VTSAGSLGCSSSQPLPVSFAVVAKASPTELSARVLPGILLVVLVAIYGIVVGVRQKTPRQPFD
jgi:hypothetical protein